MGNLVTKAECAVTTGKLQPIAASGLDLISGLLSPARGRG